jgi:hypothetical protein
VVGACTDEWPWPGHIKTAKQTCDCPGHLSVDSATALAQSSRGISVVLNKSQSLATVTASECQDLASTRPTWVFPLGQKLPPRNGRYDSSPLSWRTYDAQALRIG